MISLQTQSLSSQFILRLVLCITSLGLGYQLGGFFAPPSPPLLQKEPETTPHTEEDVGMEDILDGDLGAVTAGYLEQCKLVLVVRTDLKMTPGNIATQCGHATIACFKALSEKNKKLVTHWERTGQAKIALKATSEDQLIELEAIAKSLNLCARSITEKIRGPRQMEPASATRNVLAIGPAPVQLINQVTGKLKLL